MQEVAAIIADSFRAFAIFDIESGLRSPAITPLVTQTLYSIPIELRRAACAQDRSKAENARNEMARMISAALLQRYHFEQLKHAGSSCHSNCQQAFEEQFGRRRGGKADQR
ncbi:transposase (plasmid) [Sinorhizobium americanum CCGM7]|nr:transposase [Sinorhizobium americanum CCGM7]